MHISQCLLFPVISLFSTFPPRWVQSSSTPFHLTGQRERGRESNQGIKDDYRDLCRIWRKRNEERMLLFSNHHHPCLFLSHPLVSWGIFIPCSSYDLFIHPFIFILLFFCFLHLVIYIIGQGSKGGEGRKEFIFVLLTPELTLACNIFPPILSYPTISDSTFSTLMEPKLYKRIVSLFAFFSLQTMELPTSFQTEIELKNGNCNIECAIPVPLNRWMAGSPIFNGPIISYFYSKILCRFSSFWNRMYHPNSYIGNIEVRSELTLRSPWLIHLISSRSWIGIGTRIFWAKHVNKQQYCAFPSQCSKFRHISSLYYSLIPIIHSLEVAFKLFFSFQK